MKYCPKCKNFYNDQLLRFCIKDGVPLVGINQTDKLWSNGQIAVRETARKIRREVRKQRIKKTLSILITTILMIMIISVITSWGWIYLNKPEDETTKFSSPTPMVESSPIATPETVLVELITPTPTPKPTPSPSPVTSPTVTFSPTVKITVTPPICGDKEKKLAESQIRTAKYGEFAKDILNAYGKDAKKSFRQQHQIFQAREFDVYNELKVFEVKVIDCENAKVILNSELSPSLRLDIPIRPFPVSISYDCSKSGNGWKCSLK